MKIRFAIIYFVLLLPLNDALAATIYGATPRLMAYRPHLVSTFPRVLAVATGASLATLSLFTLGAFSTARGVSGIIQTDRNERLSITHPWLAGLGLLSFCSGLSTDTLAEYNDESLCEYLESEKNDLYEEIQQTRNLYDVSQQEKEHRVIAAFLGVSSRLHEKHINRSAGRYNFNQNSTEVPEYKNYIYLTEGEILYRLTPSDNTYTLQSLSGQTTVLPEANTVYLSHDKDDRWFIISSANDSALLVCPITAP